MFKVQDTILSDDIATAKFACDLPKCKGACCVVGDAGAPVSVDEIPKLKKAYHQLKEQLRPRAREVVAEKGVVWDNSGEGYELACTDERECVFVTYTEEGVAQCGIQKAFLDGRIDWEKPLSCHLFPVRLKKMGGTDYANFEYIPSLCSAACKKGKNDEVYLSDFLEEPLKRRYDEHWYKEFEEACEEIRTKECEAVEV